MYRRTLLRRATLGVGGIVSLAGCGTSQEEPASEESTSPPTSTPSPETEDEPPETPEQYDRVVDVTERGGDPTGEESIVPVLNRINAERTLVFLPPGRYRMDESWTVREFERTGIVGSDATIVPDPNTEAHLLAFISREVGKELRIAGLTFDYTHPEATGRMIHAEVSDGLAVRDIAARGTVARRPSLTRVDITDPNGSGIVDRLTLPNGAIAGSGVTGCYVGNNSRGTLTFRDCHIEGFPDNGLYADPPAGRIVVEGGQFINNGIANVRVRGDSIVRDAYIRCDGQHREFDNMRGIRLTDFEPQEEPEPAVVDNCRIEMLAVTHSDGGIELSSQLARGVVRNTTIKVDSNNVPAVNAKPPAHKLSEFDVAPWIRLEEVTINGDASEGSTIQISERNDGVFKDLDIYQPGSNRDGIEFRRSNGNVLRSSRIRVSGSPLILNDSVVDRDDTIKRTLGGAETN